jgi:hypothetical protein
MIISTTYLYTPLSIKCHKFRQPAQDIHLLKPVLTKEHLCWLPKFMTCYTDGSGVYVAYIQQVLSPFALEVYGKMEIFFCVQCTS